MRTVITRTVTGTRDEIAGQLAELADGWRHLDDEPRAVEAEIALGQIRAGATSAAAGHSVYEIAAESSHAVKRDVQSNG